MPPELLPCERRFHALGTTAVVLLDPDDEAASSRGADALEAVRGVTDAFDLACSRFRPDSELLALADHAGSFVPVSPVLFDALKAAVDAARRTGGLVDPTVGTAMRVLGYDRDFELVPASGPALRVHITAVPGWSRIELDQDWRRARIPEGFDLDLGATAKALCADRAAVAAAERIDAGVLVSLGGDIAIAGPPPNGGWPILVADRHSDPIDGGGPTIAMTAGGLATSGSQARRWTRGGRSLHHLLDPATGQPAVERWRTVTVAAPSCLEANVASTASFVMGDDAPDWLVARNLSARLVRPDGRVVRTVDWPDDVPSHERRADDRATDDGPADDGPADDGDRP